MDCIIMKVVEIFVCFTLLFNLLVNLLLLVQKSFLYHTLLCSLLSFILLVYSEEIYQCIQKYICLLLKQKRISEYDQNSLRLYSRLSMTTVLPEYSCRAHLLSVVLFLYLLKSITSMCVPNCYSVIYCS